MTWEHRLRVTHCDYERIHKKVLTHQEMEQYGRMANLFYFLRGSFHSPLVELVGSVCFNFYLAGPYQFGLVCSDRMCRLQKSLWETKE